MTAFTEEQLRAIERRDSSILVSAGAGTGKTSVLVERFVRAVLHDGVGVDEILAITFTDKAAAQLKSRVRARFAELNRPVEARAAESAWISTIHGFCARLLRAHALTAGIDPEFRVLDGVESERLALDAFDRALGDFLGGGEDPERLRLIAAYTPDRLADMVRTAYTHQRSRGHAEPELPEIDPPRPAGEREALTQAAAGALAEIDSAEGAAVSTAREKLERSTALLERLPAADVAEGPELKGLLISANANALKGDRCEEYRAAHAAYLGLCVRHREYLDHVLLRDLIRRYGSHYAARKRDRSGLDFDDLQLLARDLLDDDGLREQYTGRFTHLMVDEFQDTSPLQNALLSKLGRDNVFRVGDERQSIYRFRHADVDEFRRYKEAAVAAGRDERITVNFRSRGEVLDAVNLVFDSIWGASYEPLREAPGARAEPARAEPCVELLVTDREKKRWDRWLEGEELPFGPAMRAVTPWRAAEARILARRVDELTDGGRPYRYRDVVVLLRATTHLAVYERALEERGIPTFVLGGRGYWSQQQVGDLRAYLAALANPRDELALHSVLASPLGGLSLDSLVILRAAARRAGWGVWRSLETMAAAAGDAPEPLEAALEALPTGDADRLLAFAHRFASARAAAPRIALETLIDRAVTESGYDRAVLSMPAGDRRMANVRKLMRMAREYEAEEGRDLRGFIDFVAERDLVQEREGQAPLEAEDLDAVRLMTIHRAKGLEFDVVCLADLGKLGREDNSGLQITNDGRVGVRLASMGGGRMDSATLERIRQEQKLEDEEEERRIFHVAATRAREHLILSGATDFEKLSDPAPLEEPMRWIWPALAPDLALMGPRGESEVAWDGRPVRVRCEVLRPDTADDLLGAADRDPARPEPDPPGLEALAAPALAAVPVPEALPVSRLSYTGLESYGRCGYRFYLERALRLPQSPRPGPPAGDEGARALSALTRGAIVHQLLERLDFADPRVPTTEAVSALIESTGEPAREHEIADLRAMVERFLSTPMRARIAAASRVRTELPFAFTLTTAGGRSLVVNGVVDVHVEEDDRVLLIDYKSDRLDDRDPAELTDDLYSTQRLVYALAVLRSGAERVEIAHLFLERPETPVAAVFEPSDTPELERRLTELAAGITSGRFEPTATPHRGLCADCPGRPALCSWGPERTLADDPGEAQAAVGERDGR